MTSQRDIAAAARIEALRLPTFPPPGARCMWRGGACSEPALAGRWVCAAHAEAGGRNGARLRREKGRAA
jgi:hypothetical protein